MRKLLAVLVVVGVVWSSGSCFAADAKRDGQWLLGLNETAQFWFISGVVDGYEAGRASAVMEIQVKYNPNIPYKELFNHRKNVFTYGQTTAIILKYIRDNPKQWGLDADTLITLAYIDAHKN